MAKTNFLSWDPVANSNLDVGGVNIAEGCAPSGINNAIREIMAQLRADIDGGMVCAAKATNYTAVANDNNGYLRFTAAATLSLTAVATLGADWHVFVQADGGDVIVDPNASETINGAATITIRNGESALIISNGSAFFARINPLSTGTAINNATALTGANLADGDKVGVYDVSAGSLVSVLFSEFIAGIFKAARTISDARFDGPTFGLIFSTFRMTFASVLTAARTITFQDRDMTVGMVTLASGSLAFTVNNDFTVPAGVRRVVLVLNGYSTNGTSVPQIQLLVGGVPETSGYSGSASNSGSATPLANSSGFFLNAAHTAVLSYDLKIELIFRSGNTWCAFIDGAHASGTVASAGTKSLASTFNGIRLKSANGVDIPDDGGYTLYGEY